MKSTVEPAKSMGILWAVPINPAVVGRQLLYPTATHEHITLHYNVEQQPWDEWINQVFTVRIVSESWNGKSQAYKVELPDEIPFGGDVPHITLSHTEDVKPVDSVALFRPEPDNGLTVESKPLDMSVVFLIRFYDFSLNNRR